MSVLLYCDMIMVITVYYLRLFYIVWETQLHPFLSDYFYVSKRTKFLLQIYINKLYGPVYPFVCPQFKYKNGY